MQPKVSEQNYVVVVNDEEQYSLWPSYKPIPGGWQTVGIEGPQHLCLDYIETHWTDMRPLSLRKKMQERAQAWEANKAAIVATKGHPLKLSSTVEWLTEEARPVSCKEIYPTAADLRTALESNHLHLTFPQTQGQTCLSMTLDPAKTDIENADFETLQGKIVCQGTLSLDFVKLSCHTTLALNSMKGVSTVTIIQKH